MKTLIFLFTISLFTISLNAQSSDMLLLFSGGLPPAEQLASDYTERVVADGGEIINADWLLAAYQDASDNGYIDDVAIWISPSYGIKRATNNIVTFYDLSSNNNDLTQSTGDNQSLYQAAQINTIYPVAVFDGINDVYNKAFTLVQPETIYFVVRANTFTHDDYYLDGEISSKGYLRQYTTDGTHRLYAGVTVTISSSGASGSYYLYTILFNGVNGTFSLDGAGESTRNYGAFNMGGFTLGSLGSLTSGWIDMNFVEVLITRVAGTHKTVIKTFQNTKYSIY